MNIRLMRDISFSSEMFSTWQKGSLLGLSPQRISLILLKETLRFMLLEMKLVEFQQELLNQRKLKMCLLIWSTPLENIWNGKMWFHSSPRRGILKRMTNQINQSQNQNRNLTQKVKKINNLRRSSLRKFSTELKLSR